MRALSVGVLFGLATLLGSCAPRALPGTVTPQQPDYSPEPAQFSDTQVAQFLDRFPDLATLGEDSQEDLLGVLGIDLDRLAIIDTYIGDCLNVTFYDLSPSYSLAVDDNYCFGLRIRIAPK